jgi:hypothetical protein
MPEKMFDYLKCEVVALNAMLSDQQPENIAWCMRVAEHCRAITELWNDSKVQATSRPTRETNLHYNKVITIKPSDIYPSRKAVQKALVKFGKRVVDFTVPQDDDTFLGQDLCLMQYGPEHGHIRTTDPHYILDYTRDEREMKDFEWS